MTTPQTDKNVDTKKPMELMGCKVSIAPILPKNSIIVIDVNSAKANFYDTELNTFKSYKYFLLLDSLETFFKLVADPTPVSAVILEMESNSPD